MYRYIIYIHRHIYIYIYMYIYIYVYIYIHNELPKYMILKKLFTIIIHQVNSMSQLHLASELY